MRLIVVALLLCMPAIASAQLTDAQMRQRMAELNAKAAQRHASTSPAAADAAIHPEAAPPPPHWIIKPGAPPAVREWIAKQPYIRQALIDMKQEEIDQAKKELEDLRGKASFNRSSGSGFHYTSYVDRAAEHEWYQKVEAQNRHIGDLIREKKKMEADHTPRLYRLPLVAMSVGAAGDPGTCKIDQIIDGNNLIAHFTDAMGKDQSVWISMDTAGRVDDEPVSPGQIMITGTRTYETVLGGTRTVFVAEPMDVDRWVELAPATQPSAQVTQVP